MGTISSAFSIMSGALDADQQALNVVANNVANANTPGYTEEKPDWQENQPLTIGGISYGQGALKTDTAANKKKKSTPGSRRLDEKLLAELDAQRNALRTGVSEEPLTHYDRVLKLRGSALAPVYEDESCSACRVRLRPKSSRM